MFETTKHKTKVRNALSACFDSLKSDLGNVHPNMRESKYITGSILGFCRAYANCNDLSQNAFELIVDAAFEEVFRSQSISVQNRAESWLNEADDEFMVAYYAAKAKTENPLDLDWLSQYAQAHFRKARTLWHPL